MRDNILIEATDTTPEIILDFEKGFTSIKGICMPANPREFCGSFEADFLELVESNDKVRLEFFLHYFNTGASKYLFDLILEINNRVKEKSKVEFIWYVLQDDQELIEVGENLREMTQMHIDIIEVPD
jgi:hypothetical protein